MKLVSVYWGAISKWNRFAALVSLSTPVIGRHSVSGGNSVIEQDGDEVFTELYLVFLFAFLIAQR